MPDRPAVSRKSTGQFMRQGHTKGEFGMNPDVKPVPVVADDGKKELKP